jgi:hypothetical protein
MIRLSPSISTGFVQPNSLMLAAICATWASEWVRGLRAYGISSPSGRQTIARSSILRTSQSGDDSTCFHGPEFSDSAAERPDTPLLNFAGINRRRPARSPLAFDLNE